MICIYKADLLYILFHSSGMDVAELAESVVWALIKYKNDHNTVEL